MDTPPAGGNPYNDLPTIRLRDGEDGDLGLLSQRQAARLVRAGRAVLVLEVPPVVRLCISTADYRALSSGTEPEPDRLQYQHARRGALYGNYRFQNPEGEMMFHGDAEKALWYLNRGLVEVVSHDPPVLRFRFRPGGAGHAGDEYYLTGKYNRCVVCGAVEGLNRHHVVPSVYRRHLPAEVKDHSHHDVLLMCLACHEKYEGEADRLKADLGQEHGVPLHGLRGEHDRERSRAIKLALALVRHGEKIPPQRREEILRGIGAWLGQESVTEADVRTVAELSSGPGEDEELIEHGRHVIAGTRDIQGFIRRWRQHFLGAMQPRFLPEHWDVDRPASGSSPAS
jgi:hypothetical protein